MAREWTENPKILHFLKQRAQNDQHWDVRQVAIQEVARRWKNTPGTLVWVKNNIEKEALWDVRQAAIQELARGWKDDPETFEILKRRAKEDNLLLFVRVRASRWPVPSMPPPRFVVLKTVSP